MLDSGYSILAAGFLERVGLDRRFGEAMLDTGCLMPDSPGGVGLGYDCFVWHVLFSFVVLVMRLHYVSLVGIIPYWRLDVK